MAATPQQKQNAENVFNTIIKMLDIINFHYETDTSDDMPMITLTVNGDDLPMKVFIFVRPEREIVSLYSPIPVKVRRKPARSGAVPLYARRFREHNRPLQ